MEIMSYLQKIQALRDSIGIESAVGNASIGAVLMNPDSFSMTWAMVGDLLARPHNQLSDTDYSSLAWYFALLDTIQGQQRFLNYMAEPISVLSFDVGVSHTAFRGNMAFAMCPHKVANLRFQLENGIAAHMDVLMGLPYGSYLYDRFLRERNAMMARSTMLSVIDSHLRAWDNLATGRELMHVFIGNAVVGYTGGPFTISSVGNFGDTILTFQRAIAENMGTSPSAAGIQYVVATPLNQEIRFTRVLEGPGLATEINDQLEHELRIRHNFNRSAAIWSAATTVARSAVLAAAWAVSGQPEAMLHVLEIIGDVNRQAAMADAAWLRSRNIADMAHLGHYYRDFYLTGIAVRDGSDRQLHIWPSQYTYAAFNSFNNTVGPSTQPSTQPQQNSGPHPSGLMGERPLGFHVITWPEFMRNPLAHFEFYRNLNSAQRDLVSANVESARTAQRERNAQTGGTGTDTDTDTDSDTGSDAGNTSSSGSGGGDGTTASQTNSVVTRDW